MRQVFNVVRNIFGGIVFSIVLGALIIPIMYLVVNPGAVERREQNLRAEFQAIVHPEGATQIKVNIGHKIVNRWLSAEYRYKNMSDSEVEKYYCEEMTRQGWIKQPVSTESYQHFHQSIYRKGDYEMSFYPLKDSWSIHLHYRDFFDRFAL
ncbi:hypothetical protein SDC9_129979 [bioreactor metagenome]|uniref:Uncharacterized protein n=1 Tax=bioreactor metagenome TaxID=1076179 RepID=A0A645D148_9ZZZZ